MVCISICEGSVMTTRQLVSACDKCQAKVQAVADLLLLTSDLRPVAPESLVANSYSNCVEAVLARTKGLTVYTEGLKRQLHDVTAKWSDVRDSINEISDLIITMIECCSQAAYLYVVSRTDSQMAVAGIVDRYRICRSHTEINNACEIIKTSRHEDLSPELLLGLCEDIRKHLSSLTEQCHAASFKAPMEWDQDQFKLCIKSFTSCASCLMAGICNFKAHPSQTFHRRCVSFANALAASTKAAVDFAAESQFIGYPAQLNKEGKEIRKAILGSCLQLVSSCIQLIKMVQNLACLKESQQAREKVCSCAATVISACHHLELTLQQYNQTAPSRHSSFSSVGYR